MTFSFGGGPVRRYRVYADDSTLEWRAGERREGPLFRDLSWDFEEPDRYPELVASQKPGMMAPKAEKAFHRAVATGDPEQILSSAGEYPKYRNLGNALAGLLLLESSLDRGISLLGEAVASDEDIGGHHFVREYLPEAGLTVVIAAGVVVHLPLQRNSLILLLAELYQARSDHDAAIDLLTSAEQTSHVKLSLTELFYESGRFEHVLEATEGVYNDDDITALMLAYRGRALEELGRFEEAIAVLARVLEYPNRAASVKAIALVGRGVIHQNRGEHALAADDFQQALLEVPDDREAREHIEELMLGGSPPA
ncbi:MAG: hypothetical protein QNJ77_02270 [Acidimicrobiia bacterium]|nr:hypothetical protein [Acidimicrobiia bacterium]